MAEKQQADPRKIQKIAYDNTLTSDPEYYIIYDGKEDLNKWLAKNEPSKLPSKDIVTCCTIQSESYVIDQNKMDFENLHKGWKKMKESGHPINYFSIRHLAKANEMMTGGWVMAVDTELVDLYWKKIATEFAADAFLGLAIMVLVSSRIEDECGSHHVISVKSRDFADEQKIYKLHEELRSTGIEIDLCYTPDVYLYLDADWLNEFNMQPSAFFSHYDAETMELRVQSTMMPIRKMFH